MFEEENNLKDPVRSRLGGTYGAGSQDMSLVLSYTKSNKLITALFMVTDIMDKHEPLRNKLRTLGAGIISDINSDPVQVEMKASEILSFLDLALAINLISNMNGNILKQEFFKLLESVKEYKKVRSTWLEDFLQDSSNSPHPNPLLVNDRGNKTSNGHTRIGVQKGGTLLKAIKSMSDRIPAKQNMFANFDVLKKNRRADIISVLKTSNGGLTITDIKNKSKGQTDKLSALSSCGEKTLQRELVSMVKDGVLKKEGEKRWSRYSIN